MAQLLRYINGGCYLNIGFRVQSDSITRSIVLELSQHLMFNPCVKLFAAAKLAWKFTR
jgi:hypothetical protein